MMKNSAIRLSFMLLLLVMASGHAYAFKVVSGDFEFECNYFWNEMYATLTRYNGTASEVVIPSVIEYNGGSFPVKYIGDDFSHPFWENTSAQVVFVPSTAVSIGPEAFSGCTSLRSIDCGRFTQSIGDYAFYGCTQLNEVVMRYLLEEIGVHAFSGCTSLTHINIGQSVNKIGKLAFDRTGLKSITVLNHEPPTCVSPLCSDSLFYETCVLNVHIGNLEDFSQPGTEWARFSLIREHAEKGDLNSDGDIDISDLSLLIDAILGDSHDINTYDLDGDGVIDISDSNLMTNMIVGLFI